MCLRQVVEFPEDVLSKGEHCGYQFVITTNGRGFRCGYVRVPAGHPYHGKHYHDIYMDIDVHGGLTFSEPDVSCGKGADDAWWFGFDCGHGFDAPDPELCDLAELSEFDRINLGGEVRSQQYVEEQCRYLCEQVAAAAITK